MWSVSSRNCLISLGDTSSGSPRVVAGVTTSSLFKAEQRAAVLTLSPPGDTWVASVFRCREQHRHEPRCAHLSLRPCFPSFWVNARKWNCWILGGFCVLFLRSRRLLPPAVHKGPCRQVLTHTSCFLFPPPPPSFDVSFPNGCVCGEHPLKPRELSVLGEGSHCRYDDIALPLWSESLRSLLMASEPQIRAPTTGHSPPGSRSCLPGTSDPGLYSLPTSSF